MMVGYAYACAHRASVTQLVMMEAGLPGLGLEDYFGIPHMYHLPLFDAPNQLAEMLIAGRERAFVEHFVRQQTYDPTGLEEAALEEYARRLAQPGCLHGGISYFRAHKQDAPYNREQAKTKLAMPVLSIAGAASASDRVERQLRPLIEDLSASCSTAAATTSRRSDRKRCWIISWHSSTSELVRWHDLRDHGQQSHLDADDLRKLELARARRALAYLKGKIGNEAMLELLAPDLRQMTVQAGIWLTFATASALIAVLPGPGVANIVGCAVNSGHRTAFAVIAGAVAGNLIAMSASLAGAGSK